MAHALVRAGSRLLSTARVLQRSNGDGIRLYTGWSIRGPKEIPDRVGLRQVAERGAMGQNEKLSVKAFSALACCATIVLLAGCKSAGTGSEGKGGTPSPASSASAGVGRAAPSDTKQKLQGCTKLLLDSLEKPTAPYHLSYKAQENINLKYPRDAAAKPEVGPVELEADISPDQINLTSVRGKQKTEHKAAKTDQLAWSMANLELIGPVTSTALMLAFGQMVAQPAGSGTAGGVSADKYEFDTATATGSTKAGLDIARGMITNLQSTKGTVWLEKSTGKLVKFDIDASFADQHSNSWQEHYEGEVTPKQP